MTTYTITLPEDQARVLKERAAQYNLTPQEFVQQRLEEILVQPERNNSPTDQNGVVDQDEWSEEERAVRLQVIVDDLLVRRRDLYVELAKGPEG